MRHECPSAEPLAIVAATLRRLRKFHLEFGAQLSESKFPDDGAIKYHATCSAEISAVLQQPSIVNAEAWVRVTEKKTQPEPAGGCDEEHPF